MRRGKYEKQREPIFNVAICMAIVLFWLVIITTYMSSGLFAKYSTQDTGSDSARVIKFGELTLKENGDSNATRKEFIFIPGVDLEKNITVSFGGSEADTFVFVCLEPTGWSSDDHYAFTLEHNSKTIMSWEVDENWTYLPTEDGKYVYYTVLESNDSTMIDKPVIKDGKITVSAEATRGDYAALTDMDLNLDLNVTAYVVQANGFYDTDMTTSATAAWNSIGE